MEKKIHNLYEAKAQLSKLVERAAAGEEIIIAKNGKPLAQLGPLPRRRKRVAGGWKGKIWIADNFDDPLPDEVLKAFYEGEIGRSD